jgi:hypothetical protein
VVEVTGILVSRQRNTYPLELAGLPLDNPSGLASYYTGFLHTGEKFFVLAIWRPPSGKLADRDRVRVRGKFLQNFSYDIEYQEQSLKVWVPVLVAETVTPAPAEIPDPAPPLLSPLVIGFGLLFIAVAAACAVILKAGQRQFERRLKEVRRRLARKPGVGGPATNAVAPPPDAAPGAAQESPAAEKNSPEVAD